MSASAEPESRNPEHAKRVWIMDQVSRVGIKSPGSVWCHCLLYFAHFFIVISFMNLLQKGCIRIYNQEAKHTSFFGRVSSQRWANCSSRRSTFHTFALKKSSERHSLLKASLKGFPDILSESFEERYEIHFATETKPPFFELKDSTGEFTSRSTERKGKDFRFVSESLGLEKERPEERLDRKTQENGGVFSTLPSNPRKIWNDQFESMAFSAHLKSLKYSSKEVVGTHKQSLPLIHRKPTKPLLTGAEIEQEKGSSQADENFLFPHDDLKSSLILRPFEMYPNERHFIGKTDNFSLKIASSAQIERVGTREKLETREGRSVVVRYGEVENSETVSYKDFKNPHPGGLYCTRIFGPIKNWVCTHPGCSDTKKGMGSAAVPVSRKGNDEFLGAPDGRGKYREFKCSVCGNGLYPSTLRRYRMGYIHLYQPLVHVSYIHSRQNLFAHLLRWNTKEIHSLIYNNLNLINFGHTELFSACFAPLFGFCEDSLGEALEWLRGDYFALSDQATVVLRLLQPAETLTAERLSKAKTEIPLKFQEKMRSKRALRFLQSGNPGTPEMIRFAGSDQTGHWQAEADERDQIGAHEMGKTLWKKKWPRQPDAVLFSGAWENSRNFPKKIESLLCPEIATVDALLLEDQNFFINILTEWKKIFEVPKKRDITLLQKFHLEIFEQDPSPFELPCDEDEILYDLPPEVLAILSEKVDSPSHGLLGQRERIENIDFFEFLHSREFDILNLPEVENFYQNTFGTSESFFKDPEKMYSKKFTENSFFVLQDFFTKFQGQFFDKKFSKPSSSFLIKMEQERNSPETQSRPAPRVPFRNKSAALSHGFKGLLPLNFQTGQRFLDFICFRKDANKKPFLKAAGFSISPIQTKPAQQVCEASSGFNKHLQRKRLENARLQLQELVTAEKDLDHLWSSSFSIRGNLPLEAFEDDSNQTFPLGLHSSHLHPNHLNFFGSKKKFQTLAKVFTLKKSPRMFNRQGPPQMWRTKPSKTQKKDHLGIPGLHSFEIKKERSRQKFFTKVQRIYQQSGPDSTQPGKEMGSLQVLQPSALARFNRLSKNTKDRRKASRALRITPFESVLKMSASRQILAKPYFVISGIAQRITRPKKQVARSGLGFSLPLSHPAFAQNFVTSFDLSTLSKIKSLLEKQVKKPSKLGRLSADFLPPGNPFNSFKLFERSRIFDRNDVLEECEDFLGPRNGFFEKNISLQFLSQENEFHNLLAFIESSPLYLKEQNRFLKKVHSLFFNPFFQVALTHAAAVQRKKNRKEKLGSMVLGRNSQLISRTSIQTRSAGSETDRLQRTVSSLADSLPGVSSGFRSPEPKVSAVRSEARSSKVASMVLPNSWNFSPRGAIREGDLLYGWLPSEHMMQRLIKLLGNASLGTNSSEVMLSQKPLEILNLKRNKTLAHGWTFQKLLKGQNLSAGDRKAKSYFALKASGTVRPLSGKPSGTKTGVRSKSTSEAFMNEFRTEGLNFRENQNSFGSERFDSSQFEKEGTRFALSSFHRQLQNLLFQKQTRNGFKDYHCEDGATILTQQPLQQDVTREGVGEERSQLSGSSSVSPEVGVVSAPEENIGGGLKQKPGSFLSEPEYDLNFLFDLKSPDDFGPWKRWPEFAKFFLYNGGPTLQKYFRSENWPQTARRLRKRIRRADPSVVFTKKISKLFEIPKYMGISPEKWKTFLFSKVNRTKPGLIKEKINTYFRAQRALILAEEKRLKQEMRGEDFKALEKQIIYWRVFDQAEPERRIKYEDDREKEFRTYKKTYRQRQKAIEKLRAQELKAQQRLELQQRKEKEKQQKAFERAQLKLHKEKEKEQKQQERLLKRQQEKEKKLAGQKAKAGLQSQSVSATLASFKEVEISPSQLPSGAQPLMDLPQLSEPEKASQGLSMSEAGERQVETPRTGPQSLTEAQLPESLGRPDVEFSEGLDPQSDEQQPPSKFARKKSTRSLLQPKNRKPLASARPTEEKFFETDEELFKYYCKFKYPRYTKVKRRHCISKEAIAFYSKAEPTTFGKGEQLAALKARRRKLRSNLVYIDAVNIESVFEQFPFSPEDIGWSTDSETLGSPHFGNTLTNPLWRNFLIHEMFKRNPLRDQQKLVKKDLVWEDFVTYQSYPLDINSLKRHSTTSATPRGCLSRMNALFDFDQQIKRYDLTTRKADKKKADQYYQRFHEYLTALQQPIKSARDDATASSELLENIETNPQFPFKKRTRKISDKKRLVKQYRAVLTLLKNPSCIERGVFDKFPILPPDLRPILQLGDVKAVSDMTSLYILLIQRNIRHGKILFESYGESNEFLIDSKTMVQVAADNALDKCREKNVNNLIVGRMLDYKDSATQLEQWASAKPKTKGPGALASTVAPRTLYDRLSGKEGRFRMNLLGKRVDYSGRSVIIVGPSLNVDQCGLPYEMALELFQPFVLRYMLEDPEKKVQTYLQYDPWIPDDTILDHLKLSAQLTDTSAGNITESVPKGVEDRKSFVVSSEALVHDGDSAPPPRNEEKSENSEGTESNHLVAPLTPEILPEPGFTQTESGIPNRDEGSLEVSESGPAQPIRPIKSLSQAKLILRKKKALGRMILRQIVPRFPVLLNRAPTLHRLGIQGFHPVLVYGRALHLHPLVCGSFNADFDGDQMAVHIPLSLKARFDIRMLMFAPVNWLSPATGQPTVVPSQDMVLGLFYMTLEKIALQKGRGAFFNTLSDAVQAYQTGMLEIQSQIWVRWNGPFANNQMNDESSEEIYEEHSKQGKPHSLRSSPDFHEDDFQFRRKPFFPQNQRNFWKHSSAANMLSRSRDENLGPENGKSLKGHDLSSSPSVSEGKQPGKQILSKNHLLLLRKVMKSTKEKHQSTKLVQNSVTLSPFGTAGEMTVRARWWNDFFNTRLVSTAFRGSGRKVSSKEPQILRDQNYSSIKSSHDSMKESWFETSRRQKRRRESGPVKYGRQKGFFYHSFGRFSNDEDEPIEIRIHQTGKSRKIYPDFQWLEDSKEDSSSRISYIRTTPGRALMNQLIYPSYEEQEPSGSLWAFQNSVTENLFAGTDDIQNINEGFPGESGLTETL